MKRLALRTKPGMTDTIVQTGDAAEGAPSRATDATVDEAGAVEGRQAGREWARSHRVAVAAALALAAAIPYLNSLTNGFVFDDDTQVLANPYLRNFHHLRAILTTSVWSFLGGSDGVTNYYRPMMTLGYLVCYQLFGPHAFAFHFVSLLIHVGVVLLVWRVTARLFGDARVAALAALAFALHPVHTESVDWIAGVTDLELTFFFLAAFWCYLHLPRISSAGPRGRWFAWQGATLLSLALAMVSKEQALTFPVAIVIFEHLYRDDRESTNWLEKAARYGPSWILVPVYLAVRVHFLGALAPAPSSRPNLQLDETLLDAAALLGQYFEKMLWPVKLCAYYAFSGSWIVLLPAVLGGFVALAVGVTLFVILWKRARLVSFGLVWFVLLLGPVLNAGWMPASVFAERYLYLPSIGLCWMAAWAGVCLWDAAGRAGNRSGALRWALGAAAAMVLVAGGVRIAIRNRDWRDNLTLYRRTLEISPDSYVIRTDLGKVYWDRGQRELAEREWRAAEKVSPNSAVVIANLGVLLNTEQRFDEALAILKRGSEAYPTDTSLHVDLGMAYLGLGQTADAEREFVTAVNLSPFNTLAHNELGEAYSDEGRFADAEVQFRAALTLEPNAEAWLGLGLARWRQGDASEAEIDFKNAGRASATDGRIHFLLGLLYGSTGRRAEAIAEYQAGFKLDPNNAQARAAYAKLAGGEGAQ